MPATTTAPPATAYGRPLIQVAREIGKHIATLHRWRMQGVCDATGIRHRPRMTRVGGQWYMRDEELTEFFAALAGDGPTPAGQPDSLPARSRSAEQSAERAARELDAAGIR